MALPVARSLCRRCKRLAFLDDVSSDHLRTVKSGLRVMNASGHQQSLSETPDLTFGRVSYERRAALVRSVLTWLSQGVERPDRPPRPLRQFARLIGLRALSESERRSIGLKLKPNSSR